MQWEGSIGWEEAVVKVLQLVSGRKGHLQEWTLLSVSNAATIPTWHSGSLLSTSPPEPNCFTPHNTDVEVHHILSFHSFKTPGVYLTNPTPHYGSVMPKHIVVADGVYWRPLMTDINRTTTPCMWAVQSILILKVSMLGCNISITVFDLNHRS